MLKPIEHTRGPWRWEFNAKHKNVHLVGGRVRYDITVMDFARWGMSDAVPRFREMEHDGLNLMHRLCDRPDWIAAFPDREHHLDWCARITHADARLIEEAPAMAVALQLVERGLARVVVSDSGFVEFVFSHLAYSLSESADRWSRVIEAIGWPRVYEALGAVR